MARPKSDDKREAILEAATRVIAAQGLGAPTATIAKEAGVANGSLFTYFATKAELWNALYVALKMEAAAFSLEGMPEGADARTQMRHMWGRWIESAIAHPEKRRTLALLGTADEITEASRQAGHKAMAPIAALMERSRAEGPMRAQKLGFVVALMSAAAEATIDFISSDPANAAKHARAGFEAMWRMIA